MATKKATNRAGITSGGNWIVDRVKMVDSLPGRGMLSNIRSETPSTGGAPANVLADLARLGARFPLAGVGLVGDDQDGRFILGKFRDLGVDVSGIKTTSRGPTSYTDVMTEIETGARTFFHCRGVNALFGPEHMNVATLACRIFHLGYLLLLDRMDEPDGKFGTVAARLLHSLRKQGIKTSVDVVSEEGNRFRALVPPALKHIDYLILNEIEAGRIVGRKVRTASGQLDGKALLKTMDELAEMGSMELIAIHMPEGAVLMGEDGKKIAQGSLDLPRGYIKSSVGAGDAFCAGILYGLHEGWDHAESLELGSCCAAASLAESGATEGVKPLAKVMALGKKYPMRNPPVKI